MTNRRSFLFLDVDGVLNPLNKENMMRNKLAGTVLFQDSILSDLEFIYIMTGCSIVISSSWKYDEDKFYLLKTKLEEYGIDIYGVTPNDDNRIRGIEINKYLSTYASSDHDINTNDIAYVILDDEDYDIKDYHSSSNIVKCNSDIGLTKDKGIEVMDKLLRSMKEKGYGE